MSVPNYKIIHLIIKKLLVTTLNLLVAQEEKSKDHQSQRDSSSWAQKCLVVEIYCSQDQ